MITPNNESTRSRKQAGDSIPQRPSLRYFKGSDEISTLKDTVIKCLDKELDYKLLKFTSK